MSDRIAVLNGGVIQQVGPPREVYEHPVNAFVARFMGHDNLYPITARRGNRMSTPLGELSAEDAGEGGLLLIRPETLNLLPGEVAGDNHLAAVVRERLYRGSHAEYRLEIGETILQATLNNRGRRLPEVGDRVTVTVAPEDLVTLSDCGDAHGL